MPLLAVMVSCRGRGWPVPAAGVPLRVAVPLPLSTKVTPLGKAAALAEGRRREARGRDGEAAGLTHGEGGAGGAGDGRGLVHRQGEGLGGVGTRRRCWR